jgi:hypothetical protein
MLFKLNLFDLDPIFESLCWTKFHPGWAGLVITWLLSLPMFQPGIGDLLFELPFMFHPGLGLFWLLLLLLLKPGWTGLFGLLLLLLPSPPRFHPAPGLGCGCCCGVGAGFLSTTSWYVLRKRNESLGFSFFESTILWYVSLILNERDESLSLPLLPPLSLWLNKLPNVLSFK